MIDRERLASELNELARYGRLADGGITRCALTEADQQARLWLIRRMEDAGLQVRVDAAANIIGRLDCGRPHAPSTVIGSHLDTVPQGGMFDGALGVLAGLECARAIQERGKRLPWHLEIVNFTDEEGYHNAGTFGSRAMLGKVSEPELYAHKVNTPCMAEALTALGLPVSKVPSARRPARDFRAYFELHIEQGSRLEDGGHDVGIVTGIVGIWRYTVSIAGRTGHAGTVPMDKRSDALVRSAPLFTLLPEWARARSPELVATIGQLELLPGAFNVIPGWCRFTVELRAMDSAHMQRLKELLATYVEEREGSTISVVLEKDAVAMDESLMDVLEKAGREISVCRLPSWAGHDAQSFAPLVPAAMLFIPSHRGVSHCPEEWTDFSQAGTGAQVLLDGILRLARMDGQE